MEPREEIFEVIRAGDGGLLAALLAADPSLANARSERGHSPVLIAQYHHKPDLVRTILAAGPELDVLTVALLLAREADVGQVTRNPMRLQALHSAVTNSLESVKLLVEAGAPVGAQQQKGWTPLHEAVNRNDLEMVRYLLQHDADPRQQNEEGKSAIGLAADEGFVEILNVLKTPT